jgi:outer membrane protein OmpA-like peptidoglycan-associated protein
VENPRPAIEVKMGDTSSFNDPFARRGTPAGGGVAGVRDHFREKAERDAARKAAPRDAFARAPAKTAPNRFKTARKPEPPVTAPVEVEAPTPPSTPKRAALHVVASQPVDAVAEEIEVKAREVKRAQAWRRHAARSSSLVLVSASGADVAEAPPPATTEIPKPAPAATPPPAPLALPVVKERARGGGGGGAGSGSGAPPRQFGFNQDDFVGVMLGVAMLFFLLLWMMRGGQGPAPVDNRLVGPQLAANTAATPAPPPPAQPLPDPFGDAAVDLTPKGPIPEATPTDNGTAAVQSAPAPAPVAAVPVADRKMHAWFCTAGSRLTVASRKALETELTQFSDAFMGKELIVRGYADTRGTSDYNSALGGARANVVADFLRTKGLTIVEASGVGELSGLDDNQNCANQRRVDVFVKGGPGAEPSRTCAPEPEVAELVCG